MITLIKKWEGLRTKAYVCPGGVLTIGYGTTVYPDGKPVKENDIITKEYAEVLLLDYVQKNIYPIFQKIPYDLTLDQRRAIASLVYNIGEGAFLRSKLYKAICAKDYEGIFNNWNWIKSHNKVLKGLIKRRAEEKWIFLKDI